MSKVYPSDLTAEQFAFLSTRFFLDTSDGAPRGRPRTTSLWAILNAIFYVLCEGCTWRGLPGDFPPWQTVYTYFRRWKKDGTLLAIHDELYVLSRLVEGRSNSPSELIVDSQSVKTATMIADEVGYDGAKRVKGRKRHLTIDTLGLVLRVLVTAADVPEREGGKRVLQKVKQMGATVRRVHTVWVDGGYDGAPFYQWAIDTLRWVIWVVLRPEAAQGFVLLKKRWKVERTFGWFNRYRRLSKDYEVLPETSEAFIYLAMIRIMVRRLA
ncbi:IS5 family transposase [Leptolyngbya iicbica]|uniref:IS5 family transposase n=4 Tax=Cyanophyceae TaxID=3028117 RepID=A0A4Q7E323_9CYAN|nr:IS5 family transposase [Leptolyngbya sp. LK]RZM76096.1 IS5 family transposase [Leptolyngbya sp. LK]RZM82868.1 IS5 family transposase [Leptolyngbya sp. LK]